VVRSGGSEVAGRETLKEVKTRSAARRRPLPGSPFNVPQPVVEVERFAVGDRVAHDAYGLGRVVAVEGEAAVSVDFGARLVRLVSPFAKLVKL
jgi:hypothetical protein